MWVATSETDIVPTLEYVRTEYVATDESASGKSRRPSIAFSASSGTGYVGAEFLRVFGGEATFETVKKELVLPLLGLYAELLAERKSCRDSVAQTRR